MKEIFYGDITDYNQVVYCTNGDACFIENEDMANEFMELLPSYFNEVFPEDEEYIDICQKLDGDAETFARVFDAGNMKFGFLK